MSEPSQITAKPDVKAFMDVRGYLNAFYLWRKGQDSEFSYATWAGELGFKSRSFVRLVLCGKRNLTEKSIPVFVRGLSLNKIDGDYFTSLVRFNHAGNLEARERHLREILGAKKPGSSRLKIRQHYEFLSSPLAPRIHVLIGLSDTPWTAAFIAEVLGCPPVDAEKALALLENLDLARPLRQANGIVTWRSEAPRFEIETRLGDVAIQSFHRRSLEEAAAAIDLAPETRRFHSALLPLSETEFNEVRAEIERFMESLIEKYQSDAAQGRKLCQVNLNLIPLSKPILREAKAPRAPVGGPQNTSISRSLST